MNRLAEHLFAQNRPGNYLSPQTAAPCPLRMLMQDDGAREKCMRLESQHSFNIHPGARMHTLLSSCSKQAQATKRNCIRQDRSLLCVPSDYIQPSKQLHAKGRPPPGMGLPRTDAVVKRPRFPALPIPVPVNVCIPRRRLALQTRMAQPLRMIAKKFHAEPGITRSVWQF